MLPLDDWKSSILQLNTEGLTANKISVIKQLAYKSNTIHHRPQENHCTTADKLVIPNFSLAGSVPSWKHSLATFVHEQLERSLVDQSPEQSETEWLCIDIAGYKIINIYKSPPLQLTPMAIPTFPHPVCMLVTSSVSMWIGSTAKYLLVRAWTLGQQPTTLGCYTIKVM